MNGSRLEAYVSLIDTNFYLFFGEKGLEGYKKYYPDVHTCEGNTTCEVFEGEDGGGLCCIRVRDITFIAGVVHELLHITEFVDDYFGFHSEEFRAYLIQYLTQAFVTKGVLNDNYEQVIKHEISMGKELFNECINISSTNDEKKGDVSILKALKEEGFLDDNINQNGN